jgi:hypothetical protein
MDESPPESKMVYFDLIPLVGEVLTALFLAQLTAQWYLAFNPLVYRSL